MITHADLIKLLRRRVKAGGTQKALALELGISGQYLSDILQGKRMPNEKVLRALGLERVPCYKQIRGTQATDPEHSVRE